MYCSNWRKETTGDFCDRCGAPLTDISGGDDKKEKKTGLRNKMNLIIKRRKEAEAKERAKQSERIAQMTRDGTVYCRHCYSTGLPGKKASEEKKQQ